MDADGHQPDPTSGLDTHPQQLGDSQLSHSPRIVFSQWQQTH